MKTKNGITLIALIITIIVMLILVGVTINLAANGGLFEKSRTASKDTEQKKILEELIAMAEFDNNGKINVENLISKVQNEYPEKYNWESPKLTLQGKRGTYEYRITESEISIWEERRELSELEKIVLGEEGTGRLLESAEEEFSTNGIKEIGEAYDLNCDFIVYISYKGEEYRIYCKPKDDTTGEDAKTYKMEKIEAIPETEAKLGKTVTWAGKEWIILYDNDSSIEMISKENLVDSYNIGGETNSGAIESYNDSVNNLNKACEDAVLNLLGKENFENTPIQRVRCVGSNRENPNETGEIKLYSSASLEKLPKSVDGISPGEFNGKAKIADINYREDYERIIRIDLKFNLIPQKNYWLASRNIEDYYENQIDFRIRAIRDYGYEERGILYISDSRVEQENPALGLRPVVSALSSNLQESTDGTYTIQ